MSQFSHSNYSIQINNDSLIADNKHSNFNNIFNQENESDEEEEFIHDGLTLEHLQKAYFKTISMLKKNNTEDNKEYKDDIVDTKDINNKKESCIDNLNIFDKKDDDSADNCSVIKYTSNNELDNSYDRNNNEDEKCSIIDNYKLQDTSKNKVNNEDENEISNDADGFQAFNEIILKNSNKNTIAMSFNNILNLSNNDDKINMSDEDNNQKSNIMNDLDNHDSIVINNSYISEPEIVDNNSNNNKFLTAIECNSGINPEEIQIKDDYYQHEDNVINISCDYNNCNLIQENSMIETKSNKSNNSKDSKADSIMICSNIDSKTSIKQDEEEHNNNHSNNFFSFSSNVRKYNSNIKASCLHSSDSQNAVINDNIAYNINNNNSAKNKIITETTTTDFESASEHNYLMNSDKKIYNNSSNNSVSNNKKNSKLVYAKKTLKSLADNFASTIKDNNNDIKDNQDGDKLNNSIILIENEDKSNSNSNKIICIQDNNNLNFNSNLNRNSNILTNNNNNSEVNQDLFVNQNPYSSVSISNHTHTSLSIKNEQSSQLDFILNDANNTTSMRYKRRNDQMKKRKELIEDRSQKTRSEITDKTKQSPLLTSQHTLNTFMTNPKENYTSNKGSNTKINFINTTNDINNNLNLNTYNYSNNTSSHNTTPSQLLSFKQYKENEDSDMLNNYRLYKKTKIEKKVNFSCNFDNNDINIFKNKLLNNNSNTINEISSAAEIEIKKKRKKGSANFNYSSIKALNGFPFVEETEMESILSNSRNNSGNYNNNATNSINTSVNAHNNNYLNNKNCSSLFKNLYHSNFNINNNNKNALGSNINSKQNEMNEENINSQSQTVVNNDKDDYKSSILNSFANNNNNKNTHTHYHNHNQFTITNNSNFFVFNSFNFNNDYTLEQCGLKSNKLMTPNTNINNTDNTSNTDLSNIKDSLVSKTIKKDNNLTNKAIPHSASKAKPHINITIEDVEINVSELDQDFDDRNLISPLNIPKSKNIFSRKLSNSSSNNKNTLNNKEGFKLICETDSANNSPEKARISSSNNPNNSNDAEISINKNLFDKTKVPKQNFPESFIAFRNKLKYQTFSLNSNDNYTSSYLMALGADSDFSNNKNKMSLSYKERFERDYSEIDDVIKEEKEEHEEKDKDSSYNKYENSNSNTSCNDLLCNNRKSSYIRSINNSSSNEKVINKSIMSDEIRSSLPSHKNSI